MPHRPKLETYLALADEVRSVASSVADEVSRKLRESTRAPSFRDRVLVGLAVKMYNSFQCLRKDAEGRCLEAMHHLKTLVETFIYFHWAARDTGGKSARLVYARTIHDTVRFYKQNKGYVDPAVYDEWVKQLSTATKGIENEWKGFRNRRLTQLARDVGIELQEWYNRIYRLACGPAHIGDLLDHMPGNAGKIHLGNTPTSHLRAEIALDYGLHIMWDLLKAASNYFGLGKEERIKRLEARHNAVRML